MHQGGIMHGLILLGLHSWANISRTNTIYSFIFNFMLNNWITSDCLQNKKKYEHQICKRNAWREYYNVQSSCSWKIKHTCSWRIKQSQNYQETLKSCLNLPKKSEHNKEKYCCRNHTCIAINTWTDQHKIMHTSEAQSLKDKQRSNPS